VLAYIHWSINTRGLMALRYSTGTPRASTVKALGRSLAGWVGTDAPTLAHGLWLGEAQGNGPPQVG
jgi:hypothetical protein